MKTRILLAISVLALGNGCALMRAPQASVDGNDYAYMDRIERAARVANVQVVWVNPPRVKTVAH